MSVLPSNGCVVALTWIGMRAVGAAAPVGPAAELIAHYKMEKIPVEGARFALTLYQLREDRRRGIATALRIAAARWAERSTRSRRGRIFRLCDKLKTGRDLALPRW